MRKEILYALPIASMFGLAKLKKPGITAVIEVTPIKKMRGIDKFKAAVRIKNESNERVENVKLLYLAAVTSDNKRSFTLITRKTFSLDPKQEIRIPSSGYAEVTIPYDWPVGITKARAEVVQEDFDIRDRKEINAWDVCYYAKIVNISAPKTVYVGQKFDITVSLQLDEGTWNVLIDGTKVDTIHSYGGQSFIKTYTLTAPDQPGSYLIEVKVKRTYTGEEAKSGFTITIKAKPNIKITRIEVK